MVSLTLRQAAWRRLRARQQSRTNFQRRINGPKRIPPIRRFLAIRRAFKRQPPGGNVRIGQVRKVVSQIQHTQVQHGNRTQTINGTVGNSMVNARVQTQNIGTVNSNANRTQITNTNTISQSRALVATTKPNTIHYEVKPNHMGFVGNKNTKTRQVYNRQYAASRRARRRTVFTGSLRTDAALWRSIGMRLLEKLQPNRERFDLFDKDYRKQIVQNYILNNGGLRNIGTNLKKADGSTSDEIPCPDAMKPMFAISIRPTRFDNLIARLGPWSRHLTHWAGTNGELLNKNQMVREGIVVPRLTRGEIGCYDAHYRLWKHISEHNIPHAFIMEDDADVNYGQETLNKINHLFDELRKHNVQYDLIYLGHNINKKPRSMIGGSIGTPAGVQGLFAYYVTLEGVRKLLQNALPMTQPVDDYVYVSLKRVRQFILEPRLCWVVPIEQSDTHSIK